MLIVTLALIGVAISAALGGVAVVKTVRYHGWGRQQWAPPAVPWFIAGLIIAAASLAVLLLTFAN